MRELDRRAARGDRRSLADLGLLLLCEGRITQALERLAEAEAAGDRDPGIVNDLAVTELLAVGGGGEPFAPVRAFERLAALPSGPEVEWNRDLALARLGLAREAQSAGPIDFRAVVAETRARIANGSEAVARAVDEDPRRWRLYLEGPGLVEWAEAVLTANDGARARQERFLAAIAAALHATQSDALDPGLPAALARVDERTRPALASALRAYDEGRRLLRDSRPERAQERLERAASELERHDASLALLARAALAEAHAQRLDHDRLHPLLDSLELVANEVGAPLLRARVLWLRGLSAAYLGDSARTLAAYRGAIELYARAREPGHEGFLEGSLASHLASLGETAEGWRHRTRALELLALAGDREGLTVARLYASRDLHIARFYRTAARFVSAAIEADRASGNAYYLATSLWARAEMHLAAGDLDAAGADLAELDGAVAGIESEALRGQVVEGVRLARARLHLRDDPARACALAEAAAAHYRASPVDFREAEALLAGAICALRLGRENEAVERLAETLRVTRQSARTLTDAGTEILFRDRLADGIAELLDIATGELADPGLGLRLLRLSRSSESSAAGGSAGAVDVSPVPGGARVDYAVLADRVLAWVETGGDQATLRALPGTPREIEGALARLERAARGRDAGPFELAAGALYDRLVEPLGLEPAGVRHLAVVPDRWLWRVPFGALRDPRSGRYLVERFEVALLSPPTGATPIPRAPRGSSAPLPLSLLAVGDPALGEEARRLGLARLPGAAREARAVAARFAGASALVSEAATATAVAAGLARARVAHLALHAVATSPRPLGARLLLAESPGEPAAITAADVLKLDLSALELAVLSVCSGARGLESALAGPASFARALLDAGAAAAIAALWEIPDRESVDFFDRFYRHLAGGTSPEAALAATQRELIALGDERALPVWPAFQLLRPLRLSGPNPSDRQTWVPAGPADRASSANGRELE